MPPKSRAQEKLAHAAAEGRSSKMSPQAGRKILGHGKKGGGKKAKGKGKS